jgi:uncharacterized membrane protein
MSIEKIERREPRRRTRCAQRARAWLLCIASVCMMACGGPAATEHSQDESASSATAPSWCAIEAILQLKCQRCHQRPTAHGAPFSLLTYDDTQVQDSKGKPRFAQIASDVESEYMPPQFIELDPAVAPLSAHERTTLLDWCAQGAPLTGSATCPTDP